MATISSLPSILIKSTKEDAAKLPASPPKRHRGRKLWSGFWTLLSTIRLYWDLLSHVPLDIYLSRLFTIESSIAIDDRLDLHATLPLLVVSTKGSPEIGFYHTETSEHLWTLLIKMPRDTENGRTASRITCLKFSRGNHLAVGLSDGTVRVIQQNFATLIKSPPTRDTARQPDSDRITLLPLGNASFAGGVTNVVFSPSTGRIPSDNIWLAIATEKGGIWIWNRRTGEAIRAVSTTGINEGCLHWVSILEEPEPNSASRKPQQISTGSSMGVFGGPVLEVNKATHVGESFLVFGTKNGRLQIQRLWHSSTMMVRETSIELSPTAFAQSDQRLAHRFGPASGEIVHLVMQSPNITTSEAKLTIFLASKNDADSSTPVHQFSVSLPLKDPLEMWGGWVPALTVGIFRALINFVLAWTNYRWLSRQTWPSEGDHLLIRNNDLGTRTTSASNQQNTTLISTSALSTTPFLLTTIQAKRPRRFNRAVEGECILQSHNASIPSITNKVIIKPLLPIPNDFSPLFPPPHEAPTTGSNYFTAMMAKAGITEPKPDRRRRRRPHDGGYATHAYNCGRVAWGQQKRGEAIGGFFYQPASLQDSSLAVGLFKVQY